MDLTFNRIFRTAAATTEQLIHSGRCIVYKIIPEVASTAGTIVLRNDFQLKPLAPTTPVATGIASGGGLAAATYYVKITAVDQWGYESAPSAEVNSGVLAGVGINHVTLTWDAMAGAASYRVYFGTASNTEPKYFVATTNSFNLTTTTGQLTATIPSAPSTETVKRSCAIATLQAGIDLGGVLFDQGLTVQLTNAADLTSITWVALSGPAPTTTYADPG